MRFKIDVDQLLDGSYIAYINQTAGDAGKYGTPGCVAYGDSISEAYDKLKYKIEAKGYCVIEFSHPAPAEK